MKRLALTQTQVKKRLVNARLKKLTSNNNNNNNNIVIGALGTVTKGLVQGLKDLEIKRDVENNTDEIGQDTEKGSGNLRRLAITQTHVRNHQLPLE